VQLPDEQVLPGPAPQLVPSATSVQFVVLVFGWQLRHELLGSEAVEMYGVPPIRHPKTHAPTTQNFLVPQLAPFARLVQVVVLVAGSHF
jgi:hypothetical protein